MKHLGKEVQRQLGKQKGMVFVAGKISFSVQENVMDGNTENYLDLCITDRKESTLSLSFLVPGVPRCPEGDEMCRSVVTGTSPADQLHWEGSTTARLLPLHQAAALSAWICPLSSGKEIMS